ncbi:MAG: hypothetical protein KGM98_09200 [Bacteroidota bacterium]|nr:hypothetical protein [Bacteroidota bacterium]
MKKLTDLRFVIGAFFFIVGLLLLLYGFLGAEAGKSINRGCGIIFILFSLVMFVFSMKSQE